MPSDPLLIAAVELKLTGPQITLPNLHANLLGPVNDRIETRLAEVRGRWGHVHTVVSLQSGMGIDAKAILQQRHGISILDLGRLARVADRQLSYRSARTPQVVSIRTEAGDDVARLAVHVIGSHRAAAPIIANYTGQLVRTARAAAGPLPDQLAA